MPTSPWTPGPADHGGHAQPALEQPGFRFEATLPRPVAPGERLSQRGHHFRILRSVKPRVAVGDSDPDPRSGNCPRRRAHIPLRALPAEAPISASDHPRARLRDLELEPAPVRHDCSSAMPPSPIRPTCRWHEGHVIPRVPQAPPLPPAPAAPDRPESCRRRDGSRFQRLGAPRRLMPLAAPCKRTHSADLAPVPREPPAFRRGSPTMQKRGLTRRAGTACRSARGTPTQPISSSWLSAEMQRRPATPSCLQRRRRQRAGPESPFMSAVQRP